MLTPKKDVQTVTPDGLPVAPRLEGVQVRMAVPIPDERGEICEVYNPAWGFSDDPLVYIYQILIRPRQIKGWVVHREQDDRLFISVGSIKIVLYDDRPECSTYRMINEIFLGERNRGLVKIPRGVYHAIQNIGYVDALFVNMPTRPYNYVDPDKYRLPINTDLIPYKFTEGSGW